MTTDKELNDLAYISDLAGEKMGRMVFEQFELRDKAIDGLRLQQLCSDLQREWAKDMITAPDDPRYTEWIGEWDGYKAPEQRYYQLNDVRRQVRKEVLDGLNDH